jgi:hypothetical protein
VRRVKTFFNYDKKCCDGRWKIFIEKKIIKFILILILFEEKKGA